MKILVLSQNYPSEKNLYTQAFIHTRNLIYQEEGIEVDVCSFAATESYSFEGINVYTEEIVRSRLSTYDLIVSHAPNIKNHFRFFLKNWRVISKVVIFLHGYEVMNVSKYVDPYFDFMKPSLFKRIIHQSYDFIKIPIVSVLLKGILRYKNTKIITVSNTFLSWVKSDLGFDSETVKKQFWVIPNSVNSVFEAQSYVPLMEKAADFISIRPFDEPKYAVDLLIEVAKSNPDKTFHLYGKGSLFNHVSVPKNLKVINSFLKQADIPSLLNQYKAAIMLSRCDAQGVMACEMATFGIPLIVSDMPVFREVFEDFTNVGMLSNEGPFELNQILKPLIPASQKNMKYSSSLTVHKEIDIFCSF